MTYSHLQADCLYTGISSRPIARYRVWEAFTFLPYGKKSLAIISGSHVCCVYVVVRRKMAARIAELEDAADQARNRANKLEKDKSRLQIEVRDLTVQLESVRTLRCRLLVTSCWTGHEYSVRFLTKTHRNDMCVLFNDRSSVLMICFPS